MKKRIISWLAALALAMTMFSATAFAQESADPVLPETEDTAEDEMVLVPEEEAAPAAIEDAAPAAVEDAAFAIGEDAAPAAVEDAAPAEEEIVLIPAGEGAAAEQDSIPAADENVSAAEDIAAAAEAEPEEDESVLAAANAVTEQEMDLDLFSGLEFQVVSAKWENKDGKYTIIMEISGSSWRYFYLGTYEGAVANGLNTANWIAGTKNESGNYEFRIPATGPGEEIFVTAILQSAYTGYQNGNNPIDKAFYPAVLLPLQKPSMELWVMNGGSYDVTVQNNANLFTPSWPYVYFEGGPNSTSYRHVLGFDVDTSEFSRYYLGTAAQAAAAASTEEISEYGNLSIPLKWTTTPGDSSTLTTRESPFAFSIYSKSQGKWLECRMTVNESAKTLQIDKASSVNLASVGSVTVGYKSMAYTGEKRTQNDKTVVKAKVNGTNKVLTYGTDYTISYKNNLNAGTAKMTITGKGNYTGSITANFTITPVKITYTKLGYQVLRYTGAAREDCAPNVKAKVNGKWTNLAEGTDYTVKYDNNKDVGWGTVTITGKGNFTGTMVKNFQIRPKYTSIQAVSSPKVGQFKVAWKNMDDDNQIDGYQFWYSTDPEFAEGSYKATSKPKGTYVATKTTGVVSGETYYIKVRCFKNVDGQTFYSSWCGVKSIKIK